jgi:hypothetical protein
MKIGGSAGPRLWREEAVTLLAIPALAEQPLVESGFSRHGQVHETPGQGCKKGGARRCKKGAIRLSASDLVGHLNCRNLTELDLAVASGTLAKPTIWNPLLDVLQERGWRHEEQYVGTSERRASISKPLPA